MKRNDRQLDLFAPSAAPSAPAVSPDAARRERERLEALAAKLPPHVRFGTSSWTFPGWAGIVYADRYRSDADFKRRSLAEYARHPLFRTVGIDRTYYAPIGESDLALYASQLPEGFPCVSKVWSELTTMVFPRHARLGERAGRPNPSFLDRERFVETFATPYRRAFAGHAGPFVLEIPRTPGPPDVRAFEAALERFLSGAPGDLRYAVELRDERLLGRRYVEILRAYGATHVFSYWSQMPALGEQLEVAGTMPGPFVVVRLLLPPGTRYEAQREAFTPFDRIQALDQPMRDDVVRLVREAGERGYEIFILVNNKAEGSAPLTIHALAEALTK